MQSLSQVWARSHFSSSPQSTARSQSSSSLPTGCRYAHTLMQIVSRWWVKSYDLQIDKLRRLIFEGVQPDELNITCKIKVSKNPFDRGNKCTSLTGETAYSGSLGHDTPANHLTYPLWTEVLADMRDLPCEICPIWTQQDCHLDIMPLLVCNVKIMPVLVTTCSSEVAMPSEKRPLC